MQAGLMFEARTAEKLVAADRKAVQIRNVHGAALVQRAGRANTSTLQAAQMGVQASNGHLPELLMEALGSILMTAGARVAGLADCLLLRSQMAP